MPELDWQPAGRVTYLPVEQLPAWDEAVRAYTTTAEFQQRAAAARKARAGPGASTPTFQDPTLTETFARYINGETELRGQVLAQMRAAFHAAEET